MQFSFILPVTEHSKQHGNLVFTVLIHLRDVCVFCWLLCCVGGRFCVVSAMYSVMLGVQFWSASATQIEK